jgi:hypothetical protein
MVYEIKEYIYVQQNFPWTIFCNMLTIYYILRPNLKQDISISGEGKCVEQNVPIRITGKRVQLYVKGEASDYVFENYEWVQVRTQNPSLTFVQTDKPMYKPGQLGKWLSLWHCPQLHNSALNHKVKYRILLSGSSFSLQVQTLFYMNASAKTYT